MRKPPEQEVEARGLENPLKVTVKAVFPSLVSTQAPGSSGKMTRLITYQKDEPAVTDFSRSVYRSEFSHTGPWRETTKVTGWAERNYRAVF